MCILPAKSVLMNNCSPLPHEFIYVKDTVLPLAANNRATVVGENGGKWLRKRYMDPERRACDISKPGTFVIVSGLTLRTVFGDQLRPLDSHSLHNRFETVEMKRSDVLQMKTIRGLLHFCGNNKPKDRSTRFEKRVNHWVGPQMCDFKKAIC